MKLNKDNDKPEASISMEAVKKTTPFFPRFLFYGRL